jgi:hypothetical protein
MIMSPPPERRSRRQHPAIGCVSQMIEDVAYRCEDCGGEVLRSVPRAG